MHISTRHIKIEYWYCARTLQQYTVTFESQPTPSRTYSTAYHRQLWSTTKSNVLVVNSKCYVSFWRCFSVILLEHSRRLAWGWPPHKTNFSCKIHYLIYHSWETYSKLPYFKEYVGIACKRFLCFFITQYNAMGTVPTCVPSTHTSANFFSLLLRRPRIFWITALISRRSPPPPPRSAAVFVGSSKGKGRALPVWRISQILPLLLKHMVDFFLVLAAITGPAMQSILFRIKCVPRVR